MRGTKQIVIGVKEYFYILIAIILLTDLTILLNVPFLREILGFLFLTFLPGLLILQILKLNKLGTTEKLVLSVGLSIFFLMFFGLLVNNLSLSLGYETPLSTISLLISFNIVFIIMAIIGYKLNKLENLTFSTPKLNLDTPGKAFLCVPILFPALSILGTHAMKTTNNNIILMLLLFLIPTYIAFVCFFNQRFPKRIYPIVIYSISISLLLICMLRFPHIYGHDVHMEYGIFFQHTLDNLHWSILGYSTLNACLSISLLPTIYESIMNTNVHEYLFKGVYVVIRSFSPLAIYVISKRYIDEIYAFLATFFFMSQSTFLATAGSPRTNLALFFVALAVLVLFSDKINPLQKRILFIIFLLAMVVSHYSTTYIFFFVILFTWFVVEILLKKYTFKKVLSITTVILFFAFIFFWYSQVILTPFCQGVEFIEKSFSSLNNFFIAESRSTEIQMLTGGELHFPIVSRVSWIVTWCILILMGIGVLTFVKRYKEMVAISNIKLKKPDFLKTKFEMEYFVMTLACAGLLVITVLIPHLSAHYSINRIHALAGIILCICFVMGAITLANLSFRKSALPKKQEEGKNDLQVRACLIILLVLLPYFLFLTGPLYQICGAPVSLNLNSEGKWFELEYIHDQDSYGAKWLGMNGEKKHKFYTICGFGERRLLSQGQIGKDQIDYLAFLEHKKLEDGYIYLFYNNVVKGKTSTPSSCNMSEYSDMFIGTSKIYNNGGSEVYET